MPRAKLADLRGFLTASQVAGELDLSPYLIKARIDDGTLPPASKRSGNGVLLFSESWMIQAREILTTVAPRKRRRRTPAHAQVPSPGAFLGHEPGEAGWLPTWDEVIGYFEALAAASDRVDTEILGTSTDGRPYLVVAVSAADNLEADARERNRDMLAGLWDGRDTSPQAEAIALATARSTGVILASQHSNEIGAMLMTMHLAFDLATNDDPDTLDVLANTMTLIVPSHNPDGSAMIADWYRRWSGTPFEGVEMPWLYHPYVGHDNNRDWFMLTQRETLLYVDMHNREHPQAVFDMHQMGRFGPRFMVPPFIDPLDPNQDPLIQQGFAALGGHIAQRLTAAGKSGVVTNAIFDNYSPSLAYGNYHGSVDLLSEAASARLATTVTVDEDDLNADYGIDPRTRAWNNPLVWKGGTWSLAEIVSYDLIAARAFLDHLARNRRQWISDYAALAKRVSTRTEKPYAFVIPADQRDRRATAELLSTLQRGLVEVHVAESEFVADEMTFPAGTWVVRLDQPAGSFAKTLLEVQEYPNLRKWPDGPVRDPYDISGHTLSTQMGVHAIQIDRPLANDVPLTVVPEPIRYPGSISTTTSTPAAWVIDGRSNAAMAAMQALLTAGLPVQRARVSMSAAGIRAGDLLLDGTAILKASLEDIIERSGADARATEVPADLATWKQDGVRLGVYQPWTASIDEGWARWVLEEYGMPYETLHTAGIRQGNLRQRFDALLIPQMTVNDFTRGRAEKTKEKDSYPPEYVGGLGAAGAEALRRFTAEGGTLIAIDQAGEAVIDALALPIELVLRDVSRETFSCPGSLLRIVIDPAHPLGLGMPRETAVLFMDSMVFSGHGPEVSMVGRYPQSNPLLSGWLNGGAQIQGKGALAEIAYGEGRVVLIGFRPYFRAQARGTYRILFNAIFRAGLAEGMFGEG